MNKFIYSFSWCLTYLAVALLVGLCGLIVYDVFMRYCFDKPLSYSTDVATFLFIGLTYLGMGYTAQLEGHIRIDYFLNKLKPKAKLTMTIWVDILSFIILLILTWQGIELFLESWKLDVRITSTYLYPAAIFQAVIPIGLINFCLIFACNIYKMIIKK